MAGPRRCHGDRMKEKTFIIAEAGVNHNGSVSLAKKLIEVASHAGADAIKFQTFVAEEGISIHAPKADYQTKLTPENETQIEMIKRLELSYDAHVELIAHCRTHGIEFLTTVCDIKSVYLLDEFDLPLYKIASCDIVNIPLLRQIARRKKKVILSTGMSTLAEVDQAVRELEKNGVADIVLLHCTTEYPCPSEEVNLYKMVTLKNTFGLPVGFSDHSEGITASLAAVALGAEVLEKHITTDRSLEGPDHKASIAPDTLSSMVEAVREVEKNLGSYNFSPTASEMRNLEVMRRKIVAAREIKKGENFSLDNIAFKRAEGGITPNYCDLIIGKAASKNYQQDDIIVL